MSSNSLAILVSSAVAVVAILARLAQSRDALRTQRELANQAVAREMIDEATSALQEAANCIRAAEWHFTQAGRFFFQLDEGDRIMDELATSMKRCNAVSARLMILFGKDHPVVKPFFDANRAQFVVWDVLFQMQLRDHVNEDTAKLRQLRREHHSDLTAQESRFKYAQASFREGAHLAAGIGSQDHHRQRPLAPRIRFNRDSRLRFRSASD